MRISIFRSSSKQALAAHHKCLSIETVTDFFVAFLLSFLINAYLLGTLFPSNEFDKRL